MEKKHHANLGTLTIFQQGLVYRIMRLTYMYKMYKHVYVVYTNNTIYDTELLYAYIQV